MMGKALVVALLLAAQSIAVAKTDSSTGTDQRFVITQLLKYAKRQYPIAHESLMREMGVIKNGCLQAEKIDDDAVGTSAYRKQGAGLKVTTLDQALLIQRLQKSYNANLLKKIALEEKRVEKSMSDEEGIKKADSDSLIARLLGKTRSGMNEVSGKTKKNVLDYIGSLRKSVKERKYSECVRKIDLVLASEVTR